MTATSSGRPDGDLDAEMSRHASPESSAAKPWWIVTTTDDAAALKEGWKEIARKWALLWPNGRQM